MRPARQQKGLDGILKQPFENANESYFMFRFTEAKVFVDLLSAVRFNTIFNYGSTLLIDVGAAAAPESIYDRFAFYLG